MIKHLLKIDCMLIKHIKTLDIIILGVYIIQYIRVLWF